MTYNHIYPQDCRTGLLTLPDESIDCCVTSPPYFQLRDYEHPDQIGHEETVNEYVETLEEVFLQVHRVLKPSGTLWLNLGDSYARHQLTGGKFHGMHSNGLPDQKRVSRNRVPTELKPKNLIGIPWRVAFVLQDSGWILRQDIIWEKPNPMPESVTDRCTRAHEYIFMFSKQPAYYYDAESIRTELKPSSQERLSPPNWANQDGSNRIHAGPPGGKTNGNMKAVGGIRKKDKQRGHSRRHKGFNERWDAMTVKEQQAMGANRRSVWSIATRPFKSAHFAVMPEQIANLCIRAGCPPDGVVLDPFTGAGTTCLVARKQQKNFIGYEVNGDYVALAEARLQRELGMFRHAAPPGTPAEAPANTPPQFPSYTLFDRKTGKLNYQCDFFRNPVTPR